MNKIVTAIIVGISLIICSVSNTLGTLANNNYFAIKGGVSLGSYESGVNWVIIKELRSPPKDDDRFSLKKAKSFSGASAGAINALISVIEYLREDDNNTDDNGMDLLQNLFRTTWDVGIEKLLQFNSVDGRKNTHDGLFSRMPIEKKIEAIKILLGESKEFYKNYSDSKPITKLSFRSGETVYLTFSVARFIAEEQKLVKTQSTIKQHRFVLLLEVSGENGKLIFKNAYLDTDSKGFSPKNDYSFFIHLPETNGKVSFDDVANVAIASGAFPIAFSPQMLRYCHYGKDCAESDNIESAYFCDGGLFDNSPIGVSKDLQRFTTTKNSIIYISPAILRSEKCKFEGKLPDSLGLIDYATYLHSAFNVGTSQLYFRSLKDMEIMYNQKDGNNSFSYTTNTRFFPLAGNYHAHFSAFYSSDFRLHDYLVGVYDGIINYGINYDPKVEQDVEELRDRFKEWLKPVHLLIDGKQKNDEKLKLAYAYEFLMYLFDQEFNHKIETTCQKIKKQFSPNPMIVISCALQKCEQDKCKKKSEYTFEDVIKELKTYFENAIFAQDTTEIISDYALWKKKKIKPLLDRLVCIEKTSSQTCDNCDHEEWRDGLKTGIIIVKPFLESALEHQDTNIWPLSTKIENIPYSLQFGFDVRESATLFSLKPIRLKVVERLTFDGSTTFHYLSSDRANDHYFSIAGGLTYHTKFFIVPTVELGYEFSFPGKEYDKNLNSIYGYIGVIGELFRIGGSYRLDNVDEVQVSENPRSQFQLMLLIDITKIWPALRPW